MILNGGTYNGGYAAGMGGGGLVGGGSVGRVGGGGAFGGGLAGGRGWGGANGAVGARGGGGACGCDDACDGGGCGAGCGPGYDTTGVLSYVGAGGDYKQETTFTYVGQGAGDFEMVAVPSNIRSNICVCIIPLILLLLLVPLLLYLLPQLSAEPYDCKAPGVWSIDQNAWCCEHYAVGCPTPAPLPPPPAPAPLPPPPAPAPPPPPPSTTSPCPFDCNAGYNEWPLQWVKGWTGAKKLYCCKTAGRGCASELPPPSGLPPSGLPGEPDMGPYDCNAGYHPCFHCLKQQWSPKKLSWCCANMNKGCQSNTPM